MQITPKKQTWKRLTIVIDEQVESKLREIQGHLICSENQNYSLSKVANMVLLAGLVASDRLSTFEWNMVKSIPKGKKLQIDESIPREYAANLKTMEMI